MSSAILEDLLDEYMPQTLSLVSRSHGYKIHLPAAASLAAHRQKGGDEPENAILLGGDPDGAVIVL
ncbi:MAG: hypothetical protein PVJ55_06080 [Anaerolineae bacterium]|jgi:hypothetical protein